jgi:5-methylcytosine-specific restriction enzyme subunit McrC
LFTTELNGGEHDVIAILFDMNKLFEEYIYRLLLRSRDEMGMDGVDFQYHKSRRFWESSTLNPAIVASVDQAGKKMNFVIDAKWKILRTSTPSDEDLKQVYVCNAYFGARQAILIYPSLGQQNKGKRSFVAIPNEREPPGTCEIYFANLFDESDHLDSSFAREIIAQTLSPRQH